MVEKSIEYSGEPGRFISESKATGNRTYIYWDEYKGNRFLHIRVWYKDKEDGHYKPSKKGIAIPEYNVRPLLDTLVAVLNE